MALRKYIKIRGWHLSINDQFFIYLAIVIYWLSNLVKQYGAMARCLKSSLYIPLLLHIIIDLSPYINQLKITLKIMLKQKSNYFIAQSLL